VSEKKICPAHGRKRKLREEMKELVKIGGKFVDGEKEYVRREKEFKEKLQALVKKKKEKEKRERKKRKRGERKER